MPACLWPRSPRLARDLGSSLPCPRAQDIPYSPGRVRLGVLRRPRAPVTPLARLPILLLLLPRLMLPLCRCSACAAALPLLL